MKNLGLDGDVQIGRTFVANQKAGLNRQCSGNGDTLALPRR